MPLYALPLHALPASAHTTRASGLPPPPAEAGKLPLRKRTHLRAKLHRHLARQVRRGLAAPWAQPHCRVQWPP